ncbi:MAG: HD domain-containing protein [Proteocatella sp.]
MEISKTYILRDPVHLDIVFPEKYFELVNTMEFQRLSRIKQLSCEYLVFPTASHTRFSHSIGTYHVMGELIDRLENILFEYEIEVTQEQRDLALCSALLHDIGHGPFSHTFEKIFKLGNHEAWTVKIIQDNESQINKIITKNFSKSFVNKLIKVLIKENDESSRDDEQNIITLISQLISSQIDADRMDYLLRDSYFTSVSNGNYDMKRIIKSLDVVKLGSKLRICVNEKYISSIEEYIMARYYMHKEAYQHPIKLQMENVLIKIFSRAKELYFRKYSIFIDPIMEKLFLDKEITVVDYTSIDDYFMYFHISKWKSCEDSILAMLCTTFMDRKKYKRYRKPEDGLELSMILNNRLEKIGKTKILWEKEYSYINTSVSFGIYNRNTDNIWVKMKDGSIKDISQVSFVFQNMDMEKEYKRTIECFSEEMLKSQYGEDFLEGLI